VTRRTVTRHAPAWAVAAIAIGIALIVIATAATIGAELGQAHAAAVTR
jgi:hypothetical protein